MDVKENKNTIGMNGTLVTSLAFLLWGILPLYWKMLSNVSSMKILANRIVWSLVFTSILIYYQSKWNKLRPSITSFREISLLICRSFFLGSNWFIYIWGINNGQVLECSLGYFITPLMIVLLGVVFLHERLSWYQVVSLILTCIAVSILVLNYGRMPWVSILIAVSFSFYSLLRKVSRLDSLPGLTMEVAILTIPALIYLSIISIASGSFYFLQESVTTNTLLILSGIVTVIPLLLYVYGIRKIRISIAGFLQYITPTCIFLLSIFVFKENFTKIDLISFILIWIGLVVFSWKNISGINFLYRFCQKTDSSAE